jgi:hypothetical protein
MSIEQYIEKIAKSTLKSFRKQPSMGWKNAALEEIDKTSPFGIFIPIEQKINALSEEGIFPRQQAKETIKDAIDREFKTLVAIKVKTICEQEHKDFNAFLESHGIEHHTRWESDIFKDSLFIEKVDSYHCIYKENPSFAIPVVTYIDKEDESKTEHALIHIKTEFMDCFIKEDKE